MKAGLRFGIAAFAAALAFGGAPALAQNTAAPATNTTAEPPPAETIGPRELEDFSLNGTVTRPAPTAPSRTAPAPGPTPPATTRSRVTAPAPAPRTGVTARDSSPRAPSVTQSLPAPDPFSQPRSLAPADVGPPLEVEPRLAPMPAPMEDLPGDQRANYLPW